MTSTDAKARRPRPKFDAAEAELRRDHRRPNAVIAAAAGVSVNLVKAVRELLYAEGALPKIRGTRTAALRADPELCSARVSVLARRHGLPMQSVIRVRRAAQDAAHLQELLGCAST